MNDTIQASTVINALTGKTIKEVVKNEVQGRNLSITEIIFTDGTAFTLSGNHYEALITDFTLGDNNHRAVVNEGLE